MATEEITESRASRLAAEVWGIDARAALLGGWQDRNFRMSTADGRSFVLKISHPDVDSETVENQVAIVLHLAQGGLGSKIPRVVATTGGKVIHREPIAGGPVRSVRLLSHLDGRPLATVADRPERLLEDIGRNIATLALELASFHHPATRETHEWDLMALPELAPLARHIADADLRAAVESMLHRTCSSVLPHRDELEHGVIHGDLNDHNLLVDPTPERPRLSGIIDFGDALLSPVIADLAICLAYLMLDRDDAAAELEHTVRGYHGVRPLSSIERRLLPDLTTGRVCASLLHAAHGQARDPENTYLQISAEPMWKLFESLRTDDNPVTRALEAVF
jgi:Ser/Thr protein kinase RdoA (MazF antagonist)